MYLVWWQQRRVSPGTGRSRPLSSDHAHMQFSPKPTCGRTCCRHQLIIMHLCCIPAFIVGVYHKNVMYSYILYNVFHKSTISLSNYKLKLCRKCSMASWVLDSGSEFTGASSKHECFKDNYIYFVIYVRVQVRTTDGRTFYLTLDKAEIENLSSHVVLQSSRIILVY